MAVDQDRLRALLGRAAFDCRFYEGHIQDRSSAQRAMTFVGAPTWGKINGWPCLKQNAAADGTTSAVSPAIVDVTGTFSVETLCRVDVSGVPILMSQNGLGGWYIYWVTNFIQVVLQNNAGATARQLSTPAASVPVGRLCHVLMVSVTGGTSGLAWINGVPVVVTLGGAGVAANVAAAIRVMSNTGLVTVVQQRVWTGTMGQEDATCLAEQARLMIGGW